MMHRKHDWIGRLFDGFLVGILTAASALVIFYVLFRGVI